MSIFKKKKNKSEVEEVEELNKEKKKNKKEKEINKFHHIVAPHVGKSELGNLMINDKYVRSFVINGFPTDLKIGWLDGLFNSNSDIDTAIYITPVNNRDALEEISRSIRHKEQEYIKILDTDDYRKQKHLELDLNELLEQRASLEENYEKLYHIQIVSTLYANSVKELEKESKQLIDRLKLNKIHINTMFVREDDAYKTTLPFGESYIEDYKRNFNSGAVTSCFPFYNSEISHENGIYIGLNISTMTPIFINFNNKYSEGNPNAIVSGVDKSGKTFFTSLLILRSSLNRTRSVVIDPVGEYQQLSSLLGGVSIVFNEDNFNINMFDIEEEVLFINGSEDYFIDINEKSKEVANIITSLVPQISSKEKELLTKEIELLYREDWGISEDISTIYDESRFDAKKEEYVHGEKKVMPKLSDLVDRLSKNPEAQNIYNALVDILNNDRFKFIDRYTNSNLREFIDTPLMTLDISQVNDENKSIVSQILMSWLNERFIKKMGNSEKRIILESLDDVLYMSESENEFYNTVLDYKKKFNSKNAGLVMVMSNFTRLAENSIGRNLLNGRTSQFLLRQDAFNIISMSSIYKLSKGEQTALLNANTGQMLIRINDESSISIAVPFVYEKKILDQIV